MNTKELSAKELCKIINSCKENGVIELKFKDLSLNFDKKYETPASNTGFLSIAGQKDPLEDKAEILDELMLSNPVAYEEAINAESTD